jgi:hypothetical protein
MEINGVMLSRFSFHCGRQYSLGTTMDWTGAAPTRSFGCALLGILVMVAMETGLGELEF